MRRGFYGRRRPAYGTWALGGLVVVAIVGFIALLAPSYYAQETTTTTVFDKERVCDSNGDGGTTCTYLIFTDDTTYRISDSLVIGRFNSSDLYGRVQRCHRYEIVHNGWRLPFFSTYPNVVSMTDLGRAENCET